ncbi:MAG: tetrahydrofolate dehydrogenase/cyclohydrolase catalytic domain-containing protein, partial [Eubacteriales bacterium]|nr:tetrahydrofolate dehydrogenase/cyclohydrolase catalytic domain-containing protein [Eubacteriales bacterium]
MTEILRGKDVADRLTEKNVIKADELRKGGMCPTLAIVRLGENPGDLSYERGALKCAEQTGVDVKQFVYDKTITQDELLAEMDKINRDDSIHGVLIFRPLPGHIDEKAV